MAVLAATAVSRPRTSSCRLSQFLQACNEFWRRRECGGRKALAHDRQHAGIDRIGLGQRADGLCKQTRTQGIDDGDLEPGGGQIAMRQAMEFAVVA